MTHTYYRHTNDPNATLAYPHYSCPVFRTATGGMIIYGSDVANCQGEYADRLWEWGYARAEEATKQCDAEQLQQSTAKRSERWLSIYYGKPVKLYAIYAGSRVDNGYPWYFYKFDFVE